MKMLRLRSEILPGAGASRGWNSADRCREGRNSQVEVLGLRLTTAAAAAAAVVAGSAAATEYRDDDDDAK